MTDEEQKVFSQNTLLTGDLDSLTFKNGDPLDAYLENKKLLVKDMGTYYAYSNGENIWRIPKEKFEDKQELNAYQRYERDLAKTTVKDFDRYFANAMTLGTIAQNERGVNTLRNASSFGDYVSGTLDTLGPLMFASGPLGNAYRTTFGTYQLSNEEGLPKTYREFLSGNYNNAVKSLTGDAFNALIATHGGLGAYENALYGLGNYGKGAVRNYAKSRLLTKAINRDVGNTKLNIKEPVGATIRTKLGDVEINNPGLAYRQINTGGGRNFIETGYAYTPEQTKNLLAYWNGTFKPTFRQRLGLDPGFTEMKPMYSLGDLWFKPGEGDLIVTSKNLRLGNSKGGETSNIEAAGKRRISDYKGEITKDNAEIYTFEPGYGYRKIIQKEPTTINLETNTGNKIISNIIPLRSLNKVKNPLLFSLEPVLSFNVFLQIDPKINPLYVRLSRMLEKVKNGVIPETKLEMLFDATPEKVKEAVLKIDPSMSGSEVQKAVDIALNKGYGVHIPIGNDIENIGGLSIVDRKLAALFLLRMGIEPTPRNIDMIMGHEVGHLAYEIPEEAKSLLYNYTRPEEFFTLAGLILDNAGIKNTLNNPVSYENFMNMLAQYLKLGNINNGISLLAKFMESFKTNTGNKWKDTVNVLNRNKLMKYINSLSAGLYGAYLINNE